MFKIESYIGPLLMSYLNKYVKLNEESFKLSLWGGDATFHNVELQCDILEHLMLLPIGFKSGQVHELKIHIPWTKLGSESVVITLNTVECILELKSDFIKKRKPEAPSETEMPEKLSPDKHKPEKNVPPGYLKSYLVNIINNIHIKVNNLIIKFVEDDIVLSMNAKTLEYFPVIEQQQWTKGYLNFSPGNLKIHKVIEIFDLTICLDQMDSNGQIDVYQEPILYRCSVECRLFMNYQSINSNSPHFIKINIKFGEIDLNISTSQMPMLRRLIELIYALYYDVINWDSIVGCGFSKQLSVSGSNNSKGDCEIKQELVTNLDNLSEDNQQSWTSWAWSYVPSIFGEEDGLLEHDQNGLDMKKSLIFGLSFQSIQFKIKKSQISKSIFGTRRSNTPKILTHFFTVVGNNIGIHVINYGLGFFNVQLGCSEINVFSVGSVCVCGQDISVKQENNEKTHCCNLIKIGKPNMSTEDSSKFYLTGNLFSNNTPDDFDIFENDVSSLNTVTSHESYKAIYSEQECINSFSALWFDYIYFMQIVKNNLDESQIDLQNLCNTDGIRESSHCNLYVGQSTVVINSYFFHNLKEIITSVDTSRYVSYIRTRNSDIGQNIFYTTEEQMARIHEFVPVRENNISLNNLSIELHTFTESHQIKDEFPILEINAKSMNIRKLVPMYPRNLVGCVSTLNSNLLKESSELINKCCVTKQLGINGISVSFLLPVVSYSDTSETDFIKNTLLEPCDINLNTKNLLYPDTWKTTLILNEKVINISKIKLKLIPSHVKASIVIIASNYPWISTYIDSLVPKTGSGSFFKRLDELTLQLIGSQSSLIESCHKCFYKNKTYELQVSIPNFMFRYKETSTNRFIDAKLFQNSLSIFLCNLDTLLTIPVLDNNLNFQNSSASNQTEFCIFSCQIPNQIIPVNCIFNIKCQIGSLNFMLSQPVISWFIYPLLDLDLDKYIESDTFQVFTTTSRNSLTNKSPLTNPDYRSMADGSSRPESPNIFYNKHPVPGHPKPISMIDRSENRYKDKIKFLSNKTGWWNMVKNSCSKYFFLLQSLDVCIKMSKSNFYISTETDSAIIQSNYKSCYEWVENYIKNAKCGSSIFVIKLTRLALINSQRRDYLNDNSQTAAMESLPYQARSTSIIDSLPWELIFHDIRIDCLHSLVLTPLNSFKFQEDSILKPVSINCTLSATPKCFSPDKLDSLYSVSWGIHIDITEVQPTIKQIYLSKLLKFFGDIIFGLPWSEFLKNIKYLTCAHWKISKDNFALRYASNEINIQRSKQSISTKSTKRSKSSVEDQTSSASKSRIVNSKLETHSVTENETEFKMSFWIQCTLSQFQLVIENDRFDHDDSYIYIMLQIDDATSCIDVQEKFVEIKGKLGSILCQIGLMKQDNIISEIPILRMGLKFMKNSEMPYSYKSSNENSNSDDFSPDNIIRHCFSVAVIRTTPNNLSKRPISTYHQFKDNESFKSYPTEFTGNFSTAISGNNTFQSYVTQISSIIEPFDFYLPSFFLKQCFELSNSFIVLYNQLIQSSFQKWSISTKKSEQVNVSLIKNEPYFISEDMAQFFLLVKSSRIIIPRYQNDKTSIFDRQSCENGSIVLIWKNISIQPFSNNPISRPEIIEKIVDDNFTVIDSQSNFPNNLDDNRQFQLDISQCGLFLNQTSTQPTYLSPTHYNLEGLQYEWNRSTEFMSATHGQNPAFEWNNYSKLPSSIQNIKSNDIDFQPIMKPIDIQIIFAGAIHDESSKTMLKRQLIGGYGLEINISTNLEFFLDSYALDVIESITTNITDIFFENNTENTVEIIDSNKKRIASDICCLEDFCQLKNIDTFLPSVPLNVLMTTRKINLLVLLQNSKDFRQISSCCGISLSISQPHALLAFKNRDIHKLEIEFFDVNFNVTPSQWSEKIDFYNQNKPNFWYNREFFISAEMKTIMKTKPGRPDFKTGVPASLLTASFSNVYRQTDSVCMVNITRQVLFNIDIEDMKQIIGFMELLCSRFKPNSSRNTEKSSTIPLTIFIPNSFRISSELFSISIYDASNANKFDLKFGSINVSSNLIRNFDWNNLYSHTLFNCESFSVIHSVLSTNGISNDRLYPKFILYPFKINGKITLSHYRFNSIEEYWKSFDWFTEINTGLINISLDDKQLIILNKLIRKVIDVASLKSKPPDDLSSKITDQIDKRVEIFYDELRTNKFQLYTNLNTKENDNVSVFGTSLIADEATISFTDDNDDVASMLWTYPEPRCILSLEVKPVPFVFIECNVVKDDVYEQLQVPCRLEYWNNLTNEYELYKTFNLSENQTNKMDNLPTVEELTDQSNKLVVAKSWRVVFDCYARYFNSYDAINTNSEKAMLVYLSPLVLAASMKIDSCYGSFLVRNSFLKLTIPQFQLTFLEDKRSVPESDISRPYRSNNQNYTDYSISDNNILFKCICTDLSFTNVINGMIQFNVLKTELFLSDPFLALQLTISVIDNFELKYYQSQLENGSSSIQIETCQIGIDTISLKQLYITIEKMKNLIIDSVDSSLNVHSNFSSRPMLMICNNLDRRIRIRQKDDNFLKFSDESKIGGLGYGEAVVLRFFPTSSGISCEEVDKLIEKGRVQIIIGLCSELKGTIRWTNSVEIPLLSINDTLESFSNFGIFKLESGLKSDLFITNNSSTISNSFNAKNLFFLHNQYKEGFNKVMIFGNTIINNVTTHYLHVNFSLPSEIASGVSFIVPSQMDSVPVSQYINWRIMSFSSLKNVFELSFRIMNDSPANSEYRSASYQIEVPKSSDVAKFYRQQQMIIKLKLNKADGHITSTHILHIQFLCTLEWFKYFEGDELFLLITVSPLVIFENQMLCDVKLEISHLKLENTVNSSLDNKFIVRGKGGILKMINLFSSGDVKLNASFINDEKMIFDRPIELSEKFVMESLSKKLKFAQEKFNNLEENNKINYIANLINQVVENKESILNHQFQHNLYSFNVTINPWIMISNQSQLNLVLSFDKNIYFLESKSKFVPSKSDKPMKIGIMYDDDVYWSKKFSVGQNVMRQGENSMTDGVWSLNNNEEAFLQLKIVVGKHKYFIPLTLKHTFVECQSKDDDYQNSNKFPDLTIEPSIFISNRTDISLEVKTLNIAPHLVSHLEECLDCLPLSPHCGYLSIDKFSSFDVKNEDNNDNHLILNFSLSSAKQNLAISFSSTILVDMNIFSARLESEMNVETKFIFAKDIDEESKKINFKAFTVNSTINLNSKNVFVDIYECKYVPIMVTNLSNEDIYFDELTDGNVFKSSSVQIEPTQSVPFWPAGFQVNFNKEGYGDYSKPFNRFRLGFKREEDLSWTEYFPVANIDLPSNMNISTIDSTKNVQITMETNENAKLHLKISDKSLTIPQSRENAHLQTQRIKICKLLLSLLERESDMETLVESVRVSVENLNCNMSSTRSNTLYEISANQLQIDNKYYSSGLYDFPVFLNSTKSDSGENFIMIRIEINSSSSYSLDVRFQNEIELFIENIFLYDLLRLFSKFSQIQFCNKTDSTNPIFSLPPISVIRVSISPIILRMTVHAFLKIYVSCEATSLSLPEFIINDCCFRMNTLQKRLWQHYVTAVLVRCGCVLGSIELFGNPNGIIRHLTTGFSGLVSSRNIDHGLLVDFLLRLLSFCRHTSGGFISSFTGIASSVSRNLDYFTLDDTHISRQDLLRRQNQSHGVIHGFMSGLSGLALSFLGAIAGLADQPIQASQEALNTNSSVSIAVIKGLGKGFIGVVTKPLSGTAELIAQTGRGLLNSTGISVNQYHSNLVKFTLSLSNLDIFINVEQFICLSMSEECGTENNMPILYWSGVAINDDQIPVYLFLTKRYLVEWYIDQPLRNKKTLNDLSNYNFYVTSHSTYKNCLVLKYISNVNNLGIQSDNRIKAFISDLYYSNEIESNQNCSRTSSMDSAEYVKFISVPTSGTSTNQNNGENEATFIHSDQKIFYSNQLFDSLIDGLSFLRNLQDHFGDFIH